MSTSTPRTRIHELNDLSDASSMAIRGAAACLRAVQSGVEGRDASYLLDFALDALEKGEEALELDLARWRESRGC